MIKGPALRNSDYHCEGFSRAKTESRAFHGRSGALVDDNSGGVVRGVLHHSPETVSEVSIFQFVFDGFHRYKHQSLRSYA